MKIGMACDHAGYDLKIYLKKWLLEQGHEVTDFGTNSTESVDYPDYAHLLGTAMEQGVLDYGISICYTGNGISMTMNRHPGVRSALCWLPEIAGLARSHNNANVCSLPGHFVTQAEAEEIVKVFLTTFFEGGRHQRRLDKMNLA